MIPKRDAITSYHQPVYQLNIPKNPEFRRPTAPVAPSGTVSCIEFGNASERASVLSTTAMDAPFTALHELSAATVSVTTQDVIE